MVSLYKIYLCFCIHVVMIHGRHSIRMSYNSRTISYVLSNIKIIKIKIFQIIMLFLNYKKIPLLWIMNTIRTKFIKLHAKSRLVEKFFKTEKIFLRRRILWKFCICIYICCKYSWKCYLSSTVLFIMATFSSLTYQSDFFSPNSDLRDRKTCACKHLRLWHWI